MTPELYYIIILNIIVLIVGYLLGKSHNTNSIIYQNNHKTDTGSISKKNTSTKRKSNINKINIDETKVVTKIVTDNLEKKYDDLTESKESDENISSAISKLKNMKG